MHLSNEFNEQPEQGIFILPGGFITSDGFCHREFKLRHLTGKEEEIIIGCTIQENVNEVIVNILSNCIEKLIN